ncbi:MAG TPA: transposase, partial [Kineosporiaceae bacterium]
MARRASRKGNLAMRIRDVLGEVYADERFADAFGVRGKPGISPAQLMIVAVLQFTENLTDRQAAEAVRDRITWKYALGLELEDEGFDFSVLSEFRDRLVAGDLTLLALDALLERLAGMGLVKAGGRARTDSTHVLGAIRHLNRLEMAGETLRAGLEALAVAHPAWLTSMIDPTWQQTYGARIDNLRLPSSETKRAELMVAYGRDGYHLLDQVYSPAAPGWLRELPAVDVLRRVWIQQFYRDVDNATGRQEVRRREQERDGGDGLPPGHLRIISPYDVDARYSIKREHSWEGYKVHFTETCSTPTRNPDTTGTGQSDHDEQDEPPNLIINVETTLATVPDVAMTDTIHQHLAETGLLPQEHLVDSG